MDDAELDLARRAKAGDLDARNQIIMSMHKFIYGRARKYHFNEDNIDDAVNAVILRILRKFDAYNPEVGTRPISYFGKLVDHELLHYRNCCNVIPLPANALQHESTAPYARRALNILSGDAPMGMDENGDFSCLLDFLADKKTVTPDDDSQEILARQLDRLWAIINKLPNRERDIISRRLNGESLKDIGDNIGVTRERVRQLQLRGLAQLKRLWYALGDIKMGRQKDIGIRKLVLSCGPHATYAQIKEKADAANMVISHGLLRQIRSEIDTNTLPPGCEIREKDDKPHIPDPPKKVTKTTLPVPAQPKPAVVVVTQAKKDEEAATVPFKRKIDLAAIDDDEAANIVSHVRYLAAPRWVRQADGTTDLHGRTRQGSSAQTDAGVICHGK